MQQRLFLGIYKKVRPPLPFVLNFGEFLHKPRKTTLKPFIPSRNRKAKTFCLSHKLSVSKPTVNNMVNKLEAKGWVVYEKYKPIALTSEGELMAALIIRKHRITEMFLVQNMDFGWEEVHEIAEEMEHIDSSALFERSTKCLDILR